MIPADRRPSPGDVVLVSVVGAVRGEHIITVATPVFMEGEEKVAGGRAQGRNMRGSLLHARAGLRPDPSAQVELISSSGQDFTLPGAGQQQEADHIRSLLVVVSVQRSGQPP